MAASVVEGLDKNSHQIQSSHTHDSDQTVVDIVNGFVVPGGEALSQSHKHGEC